MNLDAVRAHIRDMAYMDGVERDAIRRLHTSEFFTPTAMVQATLDMYDQDLFADPDSKWCDNSCGDGQFLGEILIRKMEHGVPFERALSNLFGNDIMGDNVMLCRKRLLCGRDDLINVVTNNIRHSDSLTHDYSYGREQRLAGDTLIFAADMA